MRVRQLIQAAVVAACGWAGALAAAEPARKFAEPAAAPTASAPVSSLAQVTFSLVLVLAAVFAAAWVLKRMRNVVGGRGSDAGAITVVAERAVGPRERVVLLEVGDTRVLVGVAQGTVRALHAFERGSGFGTTPTEPKP